MIIDETLTKWFGEFDFGGCFLSDPFTLYCENLKDDYQKIIKDSAFVEKCSRVMEKLKEPDIFIHKYEGFYLVEVDTNLYSIIIQAVLAKEMGKKKIVSGVKYVDEALSIARVCNFIGIPLKLFLCRELGGISSLKEYLTGSGIEFNTEYCQDLFNLPGMYAFQDWVGLPEEIFLLNMRSNLGAYPFPSISAASNKVYGEKIFNSWSEGNRKLPRAIIAPCISGSTALSVFKPVLESDIELTTVEIEDPEMKEERDSYCGAFTLVRRDRKRDRVIAPELAYLWKIGRVKRNFISRQEAAKELKEDNKNGIFVSLESAGVIKIAKYTSQNRIMVITGRPRAGMIV